MGPVTTRRNVLIRQEYRLPTGRIVIVHDIPASEVTIDGQSETDLTLAVVRQLEKLVDRALAESDADRIELTYKSAPFESSSSPRLSA